MSIPICQCIGKLRNECEHAYGTANSYTRRRHEDPDYVDENAWEFIRTFSDETHKNYLLARHLKTTSNGQWKTLQWLMQGDLDAVLDKRMAHKTSRTGAKAAKAGECCDVSTRVNKSVYVPLTSNFGPERIEEFVAQKQRSQHVLDKRDVKQMKVEQLEVDVQATEIKDVKTFPENDPNRSQKYGKKIVDMLMKRGLGSTGFARIDEDLERVGRMRHGLELDRTGRVKSITELAHLPTAGYLTSYQRNVEKKQMKNFIKTINQFYASAVEPQPIEVDSIEELTQTLEEEFYRTFSYHRASAYGKRDQTKLRLSAIIRMLKSMPGYEAFERVLYHEPFDRDKPWTWLRTFPKRIPKEYLKRISENILNDMKKWKRQQKIIALTYSPGKRVIDVTKSKRLQKKHGRRNLKNRNQKEDMDDNDVDV